MATLESVPGQDTHCSRASMAQRTGLSKSTIGRIWKRFDLKPRAALRYNDAAIRDCASLFAEHGVNQVSPFLDNEVVTACLRIGAGERRRPGVYKPLLAMARPRPAGLADRQAGQGHFTPLQYAGLRAHHQELHELIDASTLVGHGLIDATAVHTALDATAAGIGRPPLHALENFLITSWWLSHTMVLAPTGGAR